MFLCRISTGEALGSDQGRGFNPRPPTNTRLLPYSPSSDGSRGLRGKDSTTFGVILVKSALDVYTGPVSPISLWHDE